MTTIDRVKTVVQFARWRRSKRVKISRAKFWTAMYVCFLALILVTILNAPAPAAEVKFATVLLDQDQQPMTDCAKVDDGKCTMMVPLTLGRLAAHALNQIEQGATPQAIVTRGLLAERVYQAGVPGAKPLDLTGAEIETIRLQIVKGGYRPIVIVAAIRVLDPASLK